MSSQRLPPAGRGPAGPRGPRRPGAARRRRLILGLVLLATVTGLAVAALGGSGHSPGATGMTTAPAPNAAAASARGGGSMPSFAAQARTVNQVLSYTSYVSVGSPHRREVALTFDDGPGPDTLPILRVLRRSHVKATFFEIGARAQAQPQVTAALVRAGMSVGDHSQTHPPMGRLTPAAQAAELDRSLAAITRAGAPAPLLFRPPYGSFNAATLDLLRARHLLMVLWSADTRDFSAPGVLRIRYTAISGARAGAIVLFHDGSGPRPETLASLPRIIRRLHERGFHFVTIPELLRVDPPPRNQPPPRDLSGG